MCTDMYPMFKQEAAKKAGQFNCRVRVNIVWYGCSWGSNLLGFC